MDGKMLARLGAVIFVAIAITATVIDMARKNDASVQAPARLTQTDRDLLRDGQRRCQQLGATAASDTECLAVWAETRDRFLGRTPSPASPFDSEGR